MKRSRIPRVKLSRRGVRKNEHGVALVTALLLLLLLTGMTVAMVLAVRSDMLTNGYYRNFRGSFYAADSGLAIVRQDMANRMLAKINSGTSATQPPFASGDAADVLAALKSAWANSTYNSITGGSAAGSIPAKFKIDPDTLTFASAPCVPGTNSYTCDLSYNIVAIGRAAGLQQNRIEESGTLTISVPYGPNTPQTFAGYGLYIQNQDVCPKDKYGNYVTFTPGTITGPVYTDGCFTFGTSGNYIFSDTVNCKGGQAGYSFSSSTCYQSATSSYTIGSGRNKKTIAPTFKQGIDFDPDSPQLPPDDFNQQLGAINGIGDDRAVTAADLAKLKNASGTSYSSSATSGVYMNYGGADGDGNAASFDGGGFYVAGNAAIALSTNMVSGPGCPTKTPKCYPQQIYTISQTTGSGSNKKGTLTTITVTAAPNSSWDSSDPTSDFTVLGQGTTVVSSCTVSGSNCKDTQNLSINGIPTVRDDSNNIIDNGALLYTTGAVTSLSGQVQDDTALTITAAGDVTITGNLTYKTLPVNRTTDDTLIPGNDKGQALGIFTNTGNIQLDLASAGDLEIDASLATISASPQNGKGGLTSIGANINNLIIVGGRIHNNIFSANVASRNVYFDKRFGANLVPPFFPATKREEKNDPSGKPTASFNRTHWVNQTAY